MYYSNEGKNKKITKVLIISNLDTEKISPLTQELV